MSDSFVDASLGAKLSTHVSKVGSALTGAGETLEELDACMPAHAALIWAICNRDKT